MAISQKDEMIIYIKAQEDGHVAQYFLRKAAGFDIQIGRVELDIEALLRSVMDDGTNDTYESRISTDKTALKTEIGLAIDNYYDL